MKKSTKGVLAAGAAAVLLLGGAGSLAYWTSGDTVTGTGIDAGTLKLEPADADAPCTGWTFADGTAYAAADKVVPGDVLSKTCTYTLTVTGKHLSGTISASTPTFADGSGPALVADLHPTVAVRDTTDGGDLATFTKDQDGHRLSVVVSVPFDAASSNDSQGLSATLDSITVTASQNHS